MNTPRLAIITLGSMGLLWSAARAQDGAAETKADPEKLAKFFNKMSDDEEEDLPDFDKVITKDFTEVSVISTTPGDKPYYRLFYSSKSDKLMAQIPKKELDKDFMLSNTITAGTSFSGWQWDHRVLRWERRGKKLLLLGPDVRNEGKKGSALSDAVRRTYTDRILKTVDIKALKEQDPVIDLGDLFKNDFAGVGRVFGGTLDSRLARWTKNKVFPNNIVLTVESPFSTAGPQGGDDGTLMSVSYNLSSMPESNYKPRLADDRVGYFTTVRRDWGKDYKARTLFDRYVNRWHLEKQDPTLEKSPVKNPIIFYIEKTVPVRFRHAVKEGILEWNVAFEKCGFIDAVQVRQQTEDNDFRDHDPEDVTYNFFRWATTGRGLALGPSRANPLTGQIYDADIVFDDGWIRSPMETYAIFGSKSWADELADPKMKAFFKAHPQFAPTCRQEHLVPGYGRDIVATQTLEPDFDLLPEQYRHHLCDYGADLRRELSFSHAVLAAAGYDEIPEEFLQQIVKEVVMHEVGHTLGLRHNFKASTWLSLEEVLGKPTAVRPLGGSVMDYNAFMFNPKKDKQGDYAMRTIGPYDVWAIEYGYRPVEKPFTTEDELIKSITDRVAEAGLDYATDEDTGLFEPDPLVNRRDMGSDPLEFARYRIQLVRQLQENMTEWAVKNGDSYSLLRNRFDRLLFAIANSATYAGRYIGGQYFHRDHKGDPNARTPFVMVSAPKQREAMKLLSEQVFAPDSFQFDRDLLNKLAPGRWGHWGSDEFDPWIEYNLYERVESALRLALLPVFNPFVIARLHDMQQRYGTDEDVYTLAEHIRVLTSAVWSELDNPISREYNDRAPFINGSRRALQRIYTAQLIEYILSSPGVLAPPDAYALMRMTGEGLHERVAKLAENRTLDDTSRAHLLDVQRRLRKALDAEFEQN